MSTAIQRRTKVRQAKGHQIIEFGAALSLFVAVVIPVFELCLMPLRFFLAQMVMDQTVQKLAHSESRNDAHNTLVQDRSWKELLRRCGVDVSDEKLSLCVGQLEQSAETQVGDTAPFPKQLLPDSGHVVFSYALALEANCSVAPIMSAGDNEPFFQPSKANSTAQKRAKTPSLIAPIPGLDAPLVWHVITKAPWENLSVDPYNAKFFLEE
jgi:hypothetical protein